MRSRGPIAALGIALMLLGCGGKRGNSGGEDNAGQAGSARAGGGAAKALDGSGADDDAGAVPTVVVADLKLRPASEAKRSPFVEPADDAETAARAVMDEVLRTHALDPDNAWAIAHALIVYGPDVELPSGDAAVDVMFARWAEPDRIEDTTLASFPAMKGKVPVEPHPGLVLKSVAEAGVAPDRVVSLTDGGKVPVSTLFRHAAHRVWAEEDGGLPLAWNDTPWIVQGLATWAPEDFEWTAKDRHATDLDAVTHALVVQLRKETEFLHQAMASNATVQKRKQGIFRYTCGGQHMIQGAAYAVARGYGDDGDRAVMAAEADALLFRLDVELTAVDTLIPQAPQYKGKLLAQRLKYLGHTLETIHKMAALGLVELDETKKGELRRVRREIVSTVNMIEGEGLFDRLDQIRGEDYQLYLDLVGDSAHALRGFALADGTGTIAI